MDRQAKRLEKKRKSREQAKKEAKALAAARPSEAERVARAAAREPFGPCFVSASYDDPKSPALVSVIATRELPDRRLLPVTALVDRTCLGVKNAFSLPPITAGELVDFVDEVGAPHGGMIRCEPSVVQAIVFHAVDYARSLGFEPHRDFQSTLFGPRPDVLLSTPWSKPDKPIYVSGPHDNEPTILRRLASVVGPVGFVQRNPYADGEDDELVYSPLCRTLSRDGASVEVMIYRGVDESTWLLEVEDELGGSTVWDDRFTTDEEALTAVLQAIGEDGIASFTLQAAAALP